MVELFHKCDYGQELPTGDAIVSLGSIQSFAGIGNYPFLAILDLAQDHAQPYIRGVSVQDIGTVISLVGQSFELLKGNLLGASPFN